MGDCRLGGLYVLPGLRSLKAGGRSSQQALSFILKAVALPFLASHSPGSYLPLGTKVEVGLST